MTPQRRYMLVCPVPEPLAGELASLRDAHSMPHWQPLLPFHITLVPPFNTAASPEHIASLVAPVAAASKPFTVTLDGFDRFDHATSVLYVVVAENEALTDLARRARDAVRSLTPGHYEEGRFAFTPHVTLTGKISRAEVDEYARRLEDTRFRREFLCDRFSLLRLDEVARQWDVVQTFPFTP